MRLYFHVDFFCSSLHAFVSRAQYAMPAFEAEEIVSLEEDTRERENESISPVKVSAVIYHNMSRGHENVYKGYLG